MASLESVGGTASRGAARLQERKTFADVPFSNPRSGFAALWSKLITIMAKDDPLLPGILYSFIAFSRGLGEAVSGPIADALMAHAPMKTAKYGYGTGGYVSIQ